MFKVRRGHEVKEGVETAGVVKSVDAVMNQKTRFGAGGGFKAERLRFEEAQKDSMAALSQQLPLWLMLCSMRRSLRVPR